MDIMSGSPSLNPASTPFFPGGGGFHKEDDNRGPGFGLQRHINTDQYTTSSSNLSISPTEYRSVKSSPSPSHDDRDRMANPTGDYHSSADTSRQSPAMNQPEAERGFPILQRAMRRESSMSAILETSVDGEETPGPNNSVPHHVPFFSNMVGRVRERLNTPPVAVDITSRTSSYSSVPTHLVSSSPASSLDSGSVFAPSIDMPSSFDSQLRSSPLMNEVLDRLARFEFTTREIQRDLGDVHRKISLLVERTIAANMNGPPEFRDPFAPSATPVFTTPAFNGVNGSRTSIIGNIAPNQPAPPDDMSVISHRLISLSTSVDHLLAMQTQQMQGSPAIQAPSMPAPNAQQPDILARTTGQSLSNMTSGLSHGIPNRPELRSAPRTPGPPMRTWSAGNLDIPIRQTESPLGSLGRADSNFRDKRRSVSGLLRRDSAVVRAYVLSIFSF